MSDAPLGRDEAKAKLHQCIEDGRISYSKHFRDELLNDCLTMGDVLSVCRSGAVSIAPEQDIRTGQWKYRIEGVNSDCRRIAIVFTFRTEAAALITVFERRL